MPPFQFQPRSIDLLRQLSTSLALLAEREDPIVSDEVHRLFDSFSQRDRQLEDYLSHFKTGGGVPNFSFAAGASGALSYGGTGFTLGFTGEVVEGWGGSIFLGARAANNGVTASGSTYLTSLALDITMTQTASLVVSPHVYVLAQIGGSLSQGAYTPASGIVTLHYLTGSSIVGDLSSPIQVQVMIRQPTGAPAIGSPPLSFTVAGSATTIQLA